MIHYYNMSADEWDKARNRTEDLDYYHDLDQILAPVEVAFCCLSFVMSSLNICVFTRPKMLSASTLNILLLCLESSSLVIAVGLLYDYSILLKYGDMVSSFSIFISLTGIDYVINTAVYFTNWMTVLIVAWRLVGVVDPMKSHLLLTTRKAVVFPTVIFVIAIIPIAFDASTFNYVWLNTTLCADPNCTNLYLAGFYANNGSDWFKEHENLVLGFRTAVALFFFSLPCICFSLLTAYLVIIIILKRKSQIDLQEGQDRLVEGKQLRATVILIVLMWCFLGNAVYQSVVTIVRLFCMDCLNQIAVDISGQYLFTLVVNSLSFPVYYLMGSKFRHNFRNFFRKEKSSSSKISSIRTISSLRDVAMPD